MTLFSRQPPYAVQPQILFVRDPQTQAPVPAGPRAPPPAPDGPKSRYLINQRCIYERRLPGEAYVTAHVERLQPGVYDDAVNLSKSTVPTPKPEKPSSAKPAAPKESGAQYYDYGRDPIEIQDAPRFLKKKGNRDSIRSEYLLGALNRPASYHALMNKLDDINWPSSPSSTSVASELRKNKNHDRVYFVALGFVLHPSDSLSHRFKAVKIRLTVDLADSSDPVAIPPKIIKYAPHLVSGAVSQETLNWQFNLAGSLGVTQGPVNASIQPSSQYSASTTLSKMMKIQGSTRTTATGVEDGQLLWTMEENPIQKSGLPREFTFVLLIHDPAGDPDNIDFRLDIAPQVSTWYGSYPALWQNRRAYHPLYKAPLDFREPIGQTFSSTRAGGTASAPGDPTAAYNFADMAGDLDDLVQLPGKTFTIRDAAATAVS